MEGVTTTSPVWEIAWVEPEADWTGKNLSVAVYELKSDKWGVMWEDTSLSIIHSFEIKMGLPAKKADGLS